MDKKTFRLFLQRNPINDDFLLFLNNENILYIEGPNKFITKLNFAEITAIGLDSKHIFIETKFGRYSFLKKEDTFFNRVIKNKNNIAYDYAYKLFIKYHYLTELNDRNITNTKNYDHKGFIVLNNNEHILSSKLATDLHDKLYNEYITKFKMNIMNMEAFENARQETIKMNFHDIKKEFKRLYKNEGVIIEND